MTDAQYFLTIAFTSLIAYSIAVPLVQRVFFPDKRKGAKK